MSMIRRCILNKPASYKLIAMLQSNSVFNSIDEAQKALNTGGLTVQALVEKCLHAIEELNPKISAVLALNEKAIDDARELDVSHYYCYLRTKLCH